MGMQRAASCSCTVCFTIHTHSRAAARSDQHSLLDEIRCSPADARGGHAMGRGRAKAKQTKVARRLKYYSPDTDLTALEQELKGSEGDLASLPRASALEHDQEQHIAQNYGRNRHRDDADPSADLESRDNSADDEDSASTAKRVTALPGPPAPITPGSWMKKRA